MLLIGDVHGRKHWREILKHRKPGELAILMGDYVDPYHHEGITHEEAYNELCDIVEYKKEHPDDTELLLGNHCLEYIAPSMMICRNRHDFKNERKIRKLYKDNLSLFRIAYQTTINGVEYLFTHAGVHPEWYRKVCDAFPKEDSENIADHLNRICFTPTGRVVRKAERLLMTMSYVRSKWSRLYYGSCIWADLSEWFNHDSEDIPGIRQVFGHTMSSDEYISDEISMIDVPGIGFRLDEKTNKIERI